MCIGNTGIMIRLIPAGEKIDIRTLKIKKQKGLVLLDNSAVLPFFILSSVAPEADTGQYHQAYRICG
jgi:hypothetical protein